MAGRSLPAERVAIGRRVKSTTVQMIALAQSPINLSFVSSRCFAALQLLQPLAGPAGDRTGVSPDSPGEASLYEQLRMRAYRFIVPGHGGTS